MPAEWAPHERTLMAWPCRTELWEGLLDEARGEHAGVANAVAAFEPVTMVANPGEQAAQARAACGAGVEVLELPIDDSWLRDSGPIFVAGDGGERVGVHFRFNAWGGRFTPFDSDEAAGGELARRYGDAVVDVPFVLEGGSIGVDGAGTLITTEECLLHPNRNPSMSRDEIEAGLCEHLGVHTVVWLEHGLVEDRDTDGHVDLIAAFTKPGEELLQAGAPGSEDERRMEVNRERLEAAGLAVRRLEVLPHVEVAGEQIAVSHMNFYLCNGAIVVPLSGQDTDGEALRVIGEAYPDHEVVGVPGAVLAFGGGGPHCITQQVPARLRA
ncbi:MAG: agmatine deiminase [Solirubrobacteraceae bacterium]|nr:agmatine deiminase [Solirubrobacteraceae bacterium]